MADVFISYKRDDRGDAERLAHGIRAFGYSVWWDYETQSGDRFRQEMAKQFQAANVCIALWSRASMDSAHVQRESIQAAERKKLIALALNNFAWAQAPPPIWNLAHEVVNADWDRDSFWRWMEHAVALIAGRRGMGKSHMVAATRMLVKTPMELARCDAYDMPIADAVNKVARSRDMSRLMQRRRNECGAARINHAGSDRFGEVVQLRAFRRARSIEPIQTETSEARVRCLQDVLDALQEPPQPPNRARIVVVSENDAYDLVQRHAPYICEPHKLPVLTERSSIYAIEDAEGEVVSLGVLYHGDRRVLELYPFAVESRARGYSYGTLLASAMCIMAFRLNRPLRAWIATDNAQSRTVLKRIGWREEEHPRRIRNSLPYLLNADANAWRAIEAPEDAISRAGRWLLDALRKTHLILPKGLTEQDIVDACGPRTPRPRRAGKS